MPLLTVAPVCAYIAWPMRWLTVATFSTAVRSSAVSGDSCASSRLTSATASSTSDLASPGTLSPFSVRNLSVW